MERVQTCHELEKSLGKVVIWLRKRRFWSQWAHQLFPVYLPALTEVKPVKAAPIRWKMNMLIILKVFLSNFLMPRLNTVSFYLTQILIYFKNSITYTKWKAKLCIFLFIPCGHGLGTFKWCGKMKQFYMYLLHSYYLKYYFSYKTFDHIFLVFQFLPEPL